MSRTNPQPGIERVEEVHGQPGPRRVRGQGPIPGDVWEAGTKLEEDVLAKANDTFNADNPDESEKWLNEATGWTGPSIGSATRWCQRTTAWRRTLAELRGKIDNARVVLAQLAELNKFAGDGTDAQERFDAGGMRLGL